MNDFHHYHNFIFPISNFLFLKFNLFKIEIKINQLIKLYRFQV